MFKWRVVADLVKSVGYDASSLGNHEFDDGVADLAKFLTATKQAFPSLAANLNISCEWTLRASFNAVGDLLKKIRVKRV